MELLRHPALWHAGNAGRWDWSCVATGFAVLDERLPGGGWPTGALVEILHRGEGVGELSLLLPALVQLSRTGRWIAWIAPPHGLCVPALTARGMDASRLLVVHAATRRQALWAYEQSLRCGACAAALLWSVSCSPGFTQLRRLQLAAHSGRSLAFLFRHASVGAQASPAALRLLLCPRENDLEVQVLKSRGGRPVRVRLDPGAVEGVPA